MPFQVSPGVNVSEIDLSTVVPAVSTTVGGFAGNFRWGPVDQVTLIANQDQLAKIFGAPNPGSTANVAESFFTCANFLDYANALQVVRGTSDAKNATSGAAGVAINNREAFDKFEGLGTITDLFYTKYPGLIANSVTVHTCLGDEEDFAGWAY